MGAFDEFVDHITNGTVFIESCKEYGRNVSAPLIITSISMLFMVFAGFDYLNNNRFGYGEKYYEAWCAMPALSLAMVGISALTPVLRIVLKPIVSPIYKGLGSHPAMFAGTLLACDMGGYPFAMSMAGDEISVGLYSGLVLGSMLGATIVFLIPVGMKLIPQDRHVYFAYGILIGLLTIPFGCFAGGASMAATPFKLPIIEVLKNIVPVVILCVAIGLCLFIFPRGTLTGFLWFSKIINFLMLFGTVLAIFQDKVTIKFPLFDTMVEPDKNDGENALYAALLAVGQIAIVLAGTIPMVHFIITVFGKYLAKLGKVIGMNEIDSSLLVSTLASCIPTDEKFGEMSEVGMIVNSAFQVGAAFVFGDHLGYIGAVEPDMIVPMIVGKLTSGILSVILAALTAKFFIGKIHAMDAKHDTTEFSENTRNRFEEEEEEVIDTEKATGNEQKNPEIHLISEALSEI
ncbi:Ethanolamine utilization protein EutH [Tritrichomonas foetus]|uniref:Ethanolamine utilization protein EutH n=1 Tax=Tritrichomonas foetus TaxID=1144522 RepID=A0A1J4L1C8_9EUKA|nr:Ethanolamine utilization protein EutH [Tritrichomonas foetus]|eukprot:OHT15766.1 Ethanolamine utilization protein EutH [Tritrichomonas foetus]